MFLNPYMVHVFHDPGPGFRSSLIKIHSKKIQVQMQVYKESYISVYVIIIIFFIKKVLTCEIKWNKFYSDNAHMCLIAIATTA